MDDGKNNLYRKTNFTKSGKYLTIPKRAITIICWNRVLDIFLEYTCFCQRLQKKNRAQKPCFYRLDKIINNIERW